MYRDMQLTRSAWQGISIAKHWLLWQPTAAFDSPSFISFTKNALGPYDKYLLNIFKCYVKYVKNRRSA